MKTKHRWIVRVISGTQLIPGHASPTTSRMEGSADWQADDRTALEARRFELISSKTKDAAFYLLKPFTGLPR